MHNLKIYCMCLENDYLNIVKKLNYIPVGLKNKNFSKEWLRDNTMENISQKNPFYGEYTFYYWYWKNCLKEKKKNEWVGFCSYRELWGKEKNIQNRHSIDSLLNSIPEEWEEYDTIIGEPTVLHRPKLVKYFKHGKIAVLRNFKEVFNSKQSIRFHFDMFHGNGNLDKAIKLLPKENMNEFNEFVRNNTSFNQGNMFISKSTEIINQYFSVVFSWLERCEKIFGFNLKGYNKIRMYTFLAERFLPYWFKRYTNYLEWPVVYFDINKKIKNENEKI